jgi:hypothetical protein
MLATLSLYAFWCGVAFVALWAFVKDPIAVLVVIAGYAILAAAGRE